MPTPIRCDYSVNHAHQVPLRYSHEPGRVPRRRPDAAADDTLKLWNDEMDFGDLADDIAVEALMADSSAKRSG